MCRNSFSIILIRSFLLVLSLFMIAAGCTRTEQEKKPEAVIEKEKVLVRINGEPVTEFEIMKRIKFRRGNIDESRLDQNQRQRMIEEATEEAIQDRLLLSAARAEGITIPEEQLNFSLQRSKKMLGEEKFHQMLQKSGASEEEYKAFLKDRLMLSKYQAGLFSNIKIDEEKLAEYYEGHKKDLFTPESVRIEMVLVDKKEDADAIHKRLKEGEDVDQIMQEYTAIYKKRVGGKMKWMPYDAIPEQIRPLVQKGKAGDLLEPAQIPEGYSVIKILEKRAAGIPSFDEVRSNMEQVFRMKEQQKRLEYWIAAAKQKAIIEYVN